MEPLIPKEVVEAVDTIVPAGVTQIGFVATNISGEFLVTEPEGRPYGVSATFSRVRMKPGEQPSDALTRCLRQQIGQPTTSVFPVPAVWVTPNGTGYYFAGLLQNEGVPPSKEIYGLRWLPRERAEEEIRKSQNPTSRARDLGLIRSVADMCLSPERRVLLMVRELHLMGFEMLRAPAYEYPMSWRCPVVPSTWTYREHGGTFSEQHHTRLKQLLGGGWMRYTYLSSAGQHLFGWVDDTFDSPRQLAERFLRERREIALAAWGPDQEYVEWFGRMLEMTEPNGLISTFSEYEGPRDSLYALMTPVRTVPLPPPGSVSKTEFDRFNQRFA